jgi:hypothetical protein
MVNPNRFYTYAYLREDRTPYYIGKGSGRRINENKGRPCKKPKDKSRIIFLKQNLTEEEAFKHEIYMIAVFGRKDLGTGILYNKTNGGEGPSGYKFSEESKAGMSAARKGKPAHNKGKSPSKETRTKMSKSKKGKNNPNYGKSPSKETKKKMSEAQLGEKNHRYGKKSPNYGKSLPKETRTKMSESKKDIKWWNDGCGNTKMSVECPGSNWIRGRGKFKKKP